MLKLIFCVSFVTFFSVIYCNEQIAHVNVTLMQERETKNEMNVQYKRYCIVKRESYNLTTGTTVHINIINLSGLEPDHNSFYLHTVTGNSNIYSGFQKKTTIDDISKVYPINGSYMDYELKFSFNWGSTVKECHTKIHYAVPAVADSYIKCRNAIILFAVFGILGVIIIMAETALIFYCRSKFKALTRHSNLTRLKEEDESDEDRYSTNPKKKDKKFSPIIPVDNRQSEIYEEPNITLGAPPPLPPGIPTSRSDHSNTSTLKMPPSPQSNGTSYPTFPRSNKPIREPLPKISVADRPPLPLPDEFYSVAEEDADENVYEQPPLMQPQQTKNSTPPVSKPFLLPQQLQLPQKPIPQQKPFPSAQKPIPPLQKQFQLPQKQETTKKQFDNGNSFSVRELKKQFPPPQKQETPPQKQLSALQKQFPPPQKPFPPPQKPEPPSQKQYPLQQNQTSSLKNPKSQTRAFQEQLATKLQLEIPVKPPISQAKPTPPRNKTVTPAAARAPSPPAAKPQPTVKQALKPPAAKPQTPPVSPTTLEQQVHIFNQHRDELPYNNSSDDDDEWTYEPLYNM